jgi:ketosteroid isomerase-like protein
VVGVDVMSDVLLAVRLTGAVFFDVAARSPFVTESPSSAVIGPRVMADADHVIGFHVVTRGSCWAEAVDRSDPPVRLRAGEMVIYPAGDANTMTSAPGLRGHPDPALYDRPVDSALPFMITMHSDASAEECHFVCGFLGCDIRPFNPLLEALPDVVRAPVSPASWQWMAGLLDAAVHATGHGGAGREAMLAKLAELMFVEALRAHLESLPPDARGWVAGLRDPQVGRALQVIHGHPARSGTSTPWLARSACRARRSRSGSRRTSACCRCSTSPAGVSRSPRASSRTATRSPNGERYEGSVAISALFRQLFDSADERTFDTEELIIGGDRAVVRWRHHWVDRSGRPGHVRGVDVLRVRDGKVAEKLSYVKG